MKYIKPTFYRVLILFLFINCDGTLGGFNTIRFPVSKLKLDIAIDSLYLHNPEYKIPTNWTEHDNWSKRGYKFLESNIFYFKQEPQEMYYVTYVGEKKNLDTQNYSDLAIRAVYNGKEKWLKEKDFTKEEKQRILNRFKTEIITKLEQNLNCKSIDLGY